MEDREHLDPCQILLNMTGFRRKFHIYEIAYTYDRGVGDRVYIVRKQMLAHRPTDVIQPVNEREKYSQVQVPRRDLAELYDMLRGLSLPVARTGHAGCDGSWYGLQIGIRPCSTTFRWWSDAEPELQPIYKLRDKIVKTVKQIIRSSEG